MSDNNTMYRMFRQMMQGYKLGKEGQNLFVHGVKCWMDLNPDNPFPQDSEAYDFFFRMKNYYNVWKMRGADQRINERRMIEEAQKLCETKPKNPYKFDKAAAEKEKAELREATMRRHEETLNLQRKAQQEQAERDEVMRQILEEVHSDDLQNQEDLAANRAIVEEAKAEVERRDAEKNDSEPAAEQPKKKYVFNVREEPKAEKKGWLSRLFSR